MAQNCPLCDNTQHTAMNNEFRLCSNCFGIFKRNDLLLDTSKEKERYDLHQNDANDKAYQTFVSPITDIVLQKFTPTAVGLDFGAGKSSAICKVLRDHNYNIKEYDPFFKDDKTLLAQTYHYVTSCEVIEHFYEPKKEFALLKTLLKPNGALYCMTHLYDTSIDFEKWYYKNDPTHVFIYQEKTVAYICKTFVFRSYKVENRLVSLFT
ncbi:MAG: methyltransferase domain-containing protein [Arcobacteraceae bacterium]